MAPVIGMPTQVNTHEAKTQLSKLLARVQAGEEIIIANAGRPVARLVPVEEAMKTRSPGSACGKVRIGAEFDGPLPEDVLESFER